MNIFKRIRQNKKNQQNIINQYYMGDDKFYYVFDEYSNDNRREKIGLNVEEIINNIDGQDISSPLYKCELIYGVTGSPVVSDFFKENFDYILVQFDLDRMKSDEAYAKYVFTELLEKNRIKQMYDIVVGEIEGKSFGNYVGSIVETEQGLSIETDEKIGGLVAGTSEMSKLREDYQTRKEENQRYLEKMNEQQRLERERRRKERIASLQKELALLQQESENSLNQENNIESDNMRNKKK